MTQAVNLANFANNLDSSGGVSPSALNAATPISKGGTGATTAAGAASNLATEFGKLLYPVGSIYINASSSTSPTTLLGFGTWVAFGAGRVPVGNGAGFTAGSTGGSADATLVQHQHYVSGTTGDGGAFSGAIAGGNGTGDFGIFNGAGGAFSLSGSAPNRPQGAGGGGSYTTATLNVGNHNHSFGAYTDYQGSSATNANLQPYIVVYMWQRTA